jgi:predicted ATPase
VKLEAEFGPCIAASMRLSRAMCLKEVGLSEMMLPVTWMVFYSLDLQYFDYWEERAGFAGLSLV